MRQMVLLRRLFELQQLLLSPWRLRAWVPRVRGLGLPPLSLVRKFLLFLFVLLLLHLAVVVLVLVLALVLVLVLVLVLP